MSADLFELAARHERTILDLGTGDGGAVVRLARAQPRALVVGIDADAAAMRERSAAARGRSGRAAERPLPRCRRRATAGRARSLRRRAARHAALGLAAARGNPARGVVRSSCALLRPGGTARLILSTGPREVATGLAALDAAGVAALADACACAGRRPLCVRPVTAADVSELGSSWARRLRVPALRVAWRHRSASSRRAGTRSLAFRRRKTPSESLPKHFR